MLQAATSLLASSLICYSDVVNDFALFVTVNTTSLTSDTFVSFVWVQNFETSFLFLKVNFGVKSEDFKS